MKVELIVSICLVAVGALIGAGFVTDGTWLDIADKLASVISCLVTCVAIIFAWKAYHSWKTPLQLEAYENVLNQLKHFSSEILGPTMMLMMPSSMKEFLPDAEFKNVSPEFLKSHCSSAASAIQHITTGIPKPALLKLQRMDSQSFFAIEQMQSEARKIRQHLYDTIHDCETADLPDLNKYFEKTKAIGESLTSLQICVFELEKSLTQSHGRLI